MSYRGSKKGSYGNQKRSKSFWRFGRKDKDPHNEVEDYGDNNPDIVLRPSESPLEAPNQTIPLNAQVWLTNSKSIFTPGFAVPLLSDPEVQPKIASEIKQIALAQKDVFIEYREPQGKAVKRFRVCRLLGTQNTRNYLGPLQTELEKLGLSVTPEEL